MAKAQGNEVAVAICEMLGENPNNVATITITFDAKAATQIQIGRYLLDGMGNKIVNELERLTFKAVE